MGDDDEEVFTGAGGLPRLSELDRAQGRFMLRRIREEHGWVQAEPYEARSACPDCGTTDAWLIRVNGQATVRCGVCDRHLYNAPRTETGERIRSVETVRKGLKPAVQARIFERDLQRCVFCGRGGIDVPLTIDHLIRVEDGLAVGLADAEINDEANLAAMCEACNLGRNQWSVGPRTLLRLAAAALRCELARSAGQTPAPFC